MKMKKILSLALGTAFVAASLTSQFANAIYFGDEYDFDDEYGNPFSTVIGGTTQVPFKRIIKGFLDSSQIVNASFIYSVTPSDNNPAGSTDAPFSAAIDFVDVAPVYDATTGDFVAEATGYIDFAGTYFERPGDYEYIVREVSTTNEAFELDNGSYTAVVSVRNFDDGTGVYIPGGADWLQGSVAQGMINNLTGEKEDDPTFGNNVVEKGYIELMSYENGNDADPYICFEYTLNIPVQAGLATSDMEFEVSYEQSTIEQGFCDGTADTVTPGTPAKIYLRHWQTATIGQLDGGAKQIALGTKYTITQAAVDGYTTSWGSSDPHGLASGDGLSTGELTVGAGANEVSFANVKNAAVFTGLVLGALPYVIAGILAGIGVAIVILIKKH